MTEVLEAEWDPGFFGGHMRDMNRTLGSYRASEIIFPCDTALEKHNLRLKCLLEQEVLDGLCYSSELGRNIGDEVCSSFLSLLLTQRLLNLTQHGLFM